MGGGEISEKPKSPIEKYFFEGKSEEEIKAWRKSSVEKATETKRKKKQALIDAKVKAQELLPHLLAQDLLLLDSDNYTPKPDSIEKFRKLLDAPGMTLEKLRREHFRSMSEKGWDKFTKFIFKDHVANSEDLGLQVIEQRTKEIKRLERTIRMIRKEIKLAKKESWEKYKSKRAPVGLLELLVEAEKECRTYKLDVNKHISKANLENNKAKSSTSVHIHTSIPRPEPKNVTPVKVVQSLTDLVGAE